VIRAEPENMIDPGRWIATRFDALAFKRWDAEDETVVYDRSSGRTHLITELGSALICDLAEEARTVGQLARRFSAWFEMSDAPADVERYLHATLAELQFAGLVVHSTIQHLENP
jgi:PqqD family protein of HPr-rel-A system